VNDRERFVNQMHYRPVDRCPMWDFGFWDETLVRWHDEGLPAEVDGNGKAATFFGMDQMARGLSPNIGLLPAFDAGVIEDQGDRVIYRDSAGVTYQQMKAAKTIPHFLDWTLRDMASWREHFLPRLDPDTPGRIPDNFAQRCREWADDRRDFPVAISGGSLYGWVRDWMGMENLSIALFEQPELFPTIVETIGTLICTVTERALKIADAHGLHYDGCSMWEDMCFNHGPLVSPQIVRDVMGPWYQRITDLLGQYGCDVVWLDCDGKIDELVPIWLDNGVNCMFPVEVGVWNADPYEFRRRWGKGCLMMGGFDKRILARGPEAIAAEIDRLAPLAGEGGFIPFCDHRVPADVSLADYLFYVQRAKAVWGKGIHCRPTPEVGG